MKSRKKRRSTDLSLRMSSYLLTADRLSLGVLIEMVLGTLTDTTEVPGSKAPWVYPECLGYVIDQKEN